MVVVVLVVVVAYLEDGIHSCFRSRQMMMTLLLML
jgi:hypothetical protein